ncbi:ABC transporter permease [Cuneatibacter sp. NSJ-177]|uniref:ABC transporter permease n=1 Tax=Cuneatibacter sp. NSJ-177 TaxID=2931401 RepID=UPI001FD2A250|nr:ABC transporter permease [Cuneatibacter sp. NSJ-177]MCJ7837176.1 ABC transporter permease [Cuneatibacter sp. NSJ-177]
MYKYVVKRILLMIPVLLGISFVVFFLMDLTPGSPADIIMGDLATAEAKAQLNESLGWNQPFLQRYVEYIVNVFHGDFGTSYVSGLPVFQELFSRFPTTFRLALYSMVLASLIGIPVGIACAVKQYSLIDSFSTIFALIFISIPSFWLGLLMIIVFSVQLHLLPSFGSESFAHFIMPAITCSGATLATLIRMTRSTMLEVIRQDYIRTAYAKGATKGRVIVKHALQNAMIPIITIVGVNFGYMLGGAVITENVFGMSGVGNLLLGSIRNKDIPMVMGGVLIIAVMFSIINLLLDILYAFVDPRVKAQYKKGGT